MKKSALLLSIVLVLTLIAPLSVSASFNEIIPNAPISVFGVKPLIDGDITETEGWSKPAYLNEKTAGYFWQTLPLTGDAVCRFAYDESGLYFSADITESSSYTTLDPAGTETTYDGNSFIYTTGEDDINSSRNRNNYGWNGDVLVLMLDPGAKLLANDYGSRYSPWYCVGLSEDSGVKIWRGRINRADITSSVTAAGQTTDKGWCFEICIPWQIIIDDLNGMTGGTPHFTIDDIVSSTASTHASVMYMDRFYDTDTQKVDTWGRFITVPEYLPDGTPGQNGSGDNVASYGIELNLNSYNDVPTDAWYAAAAYSLRSKSIMLGMTDDTFNPDELLSRAMFVKIISSAADAELAGFSESHFRDVDTGKWYTAPVAWAASNNLVAGYGNGLFGTNDSITREQAAQMIYRYAEFSGCDMSAYNNLNSFSDADDVSDWAERAFGWAYANNLVQGKDETNLCPREMITRAEVAQIIDSLIIMIESAD